MQSLVFLGVSILKARWLEGIYLPIIPIILISIFDKLILLNSISDLIAALNLPHVTKGTKENEIKN